MLQIGADNESQNPYVGQPIRICLELANLEGGHDRQLDDALWTRGLLIRRYIGDGELAFFFIWCPKGAAMGGANCSTWPR